MLITEVLSEYNICLPENKYIVEFFGDCGKLSYIDHVPYTLNEEEYMRYNQIEIFFAKTFKDKSKRDEYMYLENKLASLFKKIWVYSKMYVKVDSLMVPKGKINSYLDSKKRKYKSEVFDSLNTDEMVCIDSVEQLLLFAKLSCRNAITALFWIESFNVILVPLFSCIAICNLNPPEINECLVKIINSEGLFVREQSLVSDGSVIDK